MCHTAAWAMASAAVAAAAAPQAPQAADQGPGRSLSAASVDELRTAALRGSTPAPRRREALAELVRRAEATTSGPEAAVLWSTATLALRALRDERCGAFAERAVDLCRNADDRASLERMLGQVALERAQRRDYPAAVVMLREAVSICRDLDLEGRLAANLNSLAMYTRRTGAIEEAVGFAEQGLAAARAAEQANIEGVLLNSLGAWLLELGRVAEARAVFEDALPCVEHPVARFVVRGGLADADLRDGDAASARAKVLELLDEPHPAVTPEYLGAAELLLARTYEAEENWALALEKAIEAKAMVEAWPAMQVDAQIVEAHSLRRLGRAAEAIELLRATAEFARDANAKVGVDEGLAMALAAAGQHEDAFARMREVLTAEREQQAAHARARLGALRSRQEFLALEDRARESQAEQERALAEAERARLERERALAGERRARRDSILGLGALLVLGAAVGLVFRYRSERRRAAERLAAEAEHRRELEATVHEVRAELRREADGRLDLARQLEAARRHEAVAQLTAGVAHDFNNLLQVLGQSSELLALGLDGQLTEGQRTLFASCRQSVDTGARITSQLLSYARRQPLEPVPIVVSDLLESAAELFRSTVGDELGFGLVDRSGSAQILVDPAGFTTAVINLLSNARDASTGGAVTLEVNADGEDPAVPDRVDVCVRDEGKGMSEDQVARACEPFFTDKEVGSGTGLGLSMVYGFVTQSRGTMAIDSQLGVGTSVTLSFPVAKAGEPRDNDLAPIAAADEGFDALRCLVVDDNPLVRDTVARAVGTLGFSVVRCDSAAEARAWVQQGEGTIDLLVADVRMPGERGTQLARWLTARCPAVRVVLMTGFDGSDEVSEHPVLRKPFAVGDLLHVLRGMGCGSATR